MKLNRDQIGYLYTPIDVPYAYKGRCFYCGEISNTQDHVPPVSRYHDYMSLYNTHRPLTVPACSECNNLLSDSLQKDIFDRADECKIKLSIKLNRIIRYSQVWDEDGLEYAQFTGRFEIFAKGVSHLAEIAQQRMDWKPWCVSFDGIEIEKSENSPIKIDGKNFKSLDHVLEYAKKIYKIPPKYLEAMIEILGIRRAEYAIKICSSNPVKNQHQMKAVLDDVKEVEEQRNTI